MNRRNRYFLTILLLIVFGLAACSDDSDTSDANGETTEENEEQEAQNDEASGDSNEEVAPANLLDFDTSNFEDADHQTITFNDNYRIPEHPSLTFASNETFILGGNWQNYFYDYLNGKMRNFDLNGFGDPMQANDSFAMSYVFGDYFYTINNEDKDNFDQLHIVEINIKTGEKKVLTPVDSIPLLAKKGNTLFAADGEKIFAFDTNKGEMVWEHPLDTQISLSEVQATENAIILLWNEGLAVYQQSDGKKQYEAEGYFYKLAVDGEHFYVTEESEETITDFDKSMLNVYKFNENEADPERLFTASEVQTPSEYGDHKIDIENDTIYIKSTYGISAYDKNNGDSLWYVSVGDGLVQELDVSKPSHDDFDTAYHNGKVYTRTTIWQSGAEETLFTVIDGETGEMTENYSFGRGEAYGPVIDGDRALVFHLVEDENAKMYIIADE